jgi:cyclopropane fatty-acyl-phospholipid synthase-like methyltransferase
VPSFVTHFSPYHQIQTHLTDYWTLGFDETFVRLWTMYLCYCEAGFKAQVLNLQVHSTRTNLFIYLPH